MDYSFLPNGDLIIWMYDDDLLRELTSEIEANKYGLNVINV